MIVIVSYVGGWLSPSGQPDLIKTFIATNNGDLAESLMGSGFQDMLALSQPQKSEERHEGKITSAGVEADICNRAGSLGDEFLVNLICGAQQHG